LFSWFRQSFSWIFHLFCYLLLLFFFIVFLTHMYNRLVSTTCTHYRSNAGDSTLFNCCCRSMALLNFSIHVRLINQTIVVYFIRFSLKGSACPLLTICFSDGAHMNNQRIEVIWSFFFPIYQNVLHAGEKKQFVFIWKMIRKSL